MLVKKWSKAKCQICNESNKQSLIVSYDVSPVCDNTVGCDHIKIEYKCGLYPLKHCPVPDEIKLLPDILK